MNLSIFQEILTPFLTVSLISTKINLFVHWYFQRQFGYCWRQSQKKSNFSRRNHYFGVFHIHYHPMHYNITKKHTLLLHVKKINRPFGQEGYTHTKGVAFRNKKFTIFIAIFRNFSNYFCDNYIAKLRQNYDIFCYTLAIVSQFQLQFLWKKSDW